MKFEIDKDEPLFSGDVIEMHFKYLGPNWLYLRAAELALLQGQLEKKHPNWEMLFWESLEDKLVLQFLVKEPPGEAQVQVQKASVVTPIIIAATVIGGGVFMWLSLDKIYKITESPAGKIALAGTGSLGIAILVIAVLWLLYQFRK